MKEKLRLAHLGNGVTVWDASRVVGNDYPKVAHIDYEREVTYYEDISPQARARIEAFARRGNMDISWSKQGRYALRPLSAVESA